MLLLGPCQGDPASLFHHRSTDISSSHDALQSRLLVASAHVCSCWMLMTAGVLYWSIIILFSRFYSLSRPTLSSPPLLFKPYVWQIITADRNPIPPHLCLIGVVGSTICQPWFDWRNSIEIYSSKGGESTKGEMTKRAEKGEGRRLKRGLTEK